MSDRELLELAAKAIGYKILDWYDDRFRHTVYDGEKSTYWNPLVDDGDALRLAVKLRFQLTLGTYNSSEITAFGARCEHEAREYPRYLQDEFASTRRAIVRAAAEIGRAMG